MVGEVEEMMETSTESFLTTSSDQAWQAQEDFGAITGSDGTSFLDSTIPRNTTERGLDQVEAELAIANAELSSLKELLSMAETQLREVVARSALYVRDVQNAANKEIYNTVSKCNALLRRLESSGGARLCDSREEGMRLSCPDAVGDADLYCDDDTHSLLIRLKSAEKELFQTRLRLNELERELHESDSEKKRIEEHLELSVLTALKLQDVLVMQKVVMKLQKMPVADQRSNEEPISRPEEISLTTAAVDVEEGCRSVSLMLSEQGFQKRKRQVTQEGPA